MSYNKDVSIVIPLYNEEESLEELCQWINQVMESHGYSYEVILVDDGSTDNSWSIITELSQENPNLRGVRFKKNYGKSAALDTGFKHVKGEVVITMDADLQDSPDEIPGLYKMIKEDGYELVSGWKKKRYDSISKTIPSRLFNRVTRMLSGIKLHDFNCGLKAYHHQVVENIHVYGEMHRYIPVIAKWKGFNKIGEKEVKHAKRKYGKTKYGLERFIFGFLDLVSVIFVSKFSKRPMHFFGTFGVLSFLVGLIFVVKLVWEKIDAVYFSKILVQREVVDQPLFFIALGAVVIGVQLFLTGFLAEMMVMKQTDKEEYLVIEKKGL